MSVSYTHLRRRQSIERTLERRPDLLREARLTLKEQQFLDSLRGSEKGLGELDGLVEEYVKELEQGKGELPQALPYRIHRRAASLTKKLLATGECSLEDIKMCIRDRFKPYL